MHRPSFRSILAAHDPLILIGAHDGLSARLIEQTGYPAFFIGGFPLVGARYGVPDIGIKGLGEIAAGVRDILGATGLPALVDGDDGYGDVKNVAHTVRTYEDMGVGAIMIEDQTWPKRCGHMAGKDVVDTAFMVDKVQAALDARRDPDTMIVARTDARAVHGLDEALRRGAAFAEAGADILFIESPENEEEMRRIGEAFRGLPLLVNVVEGGSTPVLPTADYQAIGYSFAIYPAAGFLSAGAALREVYGHIRETGSSIGTDAPLYDFQEFSRLMGFEHVWEFEKKWAEAV